MCFPPSNSVSLILTLNLEMGYNSLDCHLSLEPKMMTVGRSIQKLWPLETMGALGVSKWSFLGTSGHILIKTSVKYSFFDVLSSNFNWA